MMRSIAVCTLAAVLLGVECADDSCPVQSGGYRDDPHGFSWNTCTGAPAGLRLCVDGITVTPVPIVTDGKTNLTVSMNMSLSGEPVTSGVIDMSLSFAGTPFWSGNWNMCDLLAKVYEPTNPPNLACPLSSGVMNLTYSFVFPTMANTSGSVSGMSRIDDQDSNQITCLAFSLPVVPENDLV